MAVKVSFKLFIVISLFFGVLFACVDPVSITSFLEDKNVNEIILENKYGTAVIDTDSNCYFNLKAGYCKISRLNSSKYYMIESEKNDSGITVSTSSTHPLYITDFGGTGSWYKDIGVISRISGGSINGLTNNHIYKIKEAADFPNGTIFTYTVGGGASQSAIVNKGIITITAASAIELVGLSSDYNGWKVMAVDAVSTASMWSQTAKTIGSGVNSSFALEGTAGAKVDYVFAKETSPVEFKVLRVETVAAGTPIYGITLSESGNPLDTSNPYTFSSALPGYGTQTALSVTVTNTGNQATGGLTVALGGANSGDFTLSTTSVSTIAIGGTASGAFTVVPRTGLGAGNYTATVTVTGGNGINTGFTVNFEVTVAPEYSISLHEASKTPAISSPYTFTSAIAGYGSQTPLSVDIKNTGNQATGGLTVALSGINASNYFTLTVTGGGSITSIPVNGISTGAFTVVPKTGLAVGNYTATVTVSNTGNGITENFNVSFTVLAKLELTITFEISDPSIGSAGNPASVSYNEIADGTKSLTFTLDGGTFTDVEWKMDGTVVNTGTSITIGKTSSILSKLTIGSHVLYVTAKKDGAPYSALITLIVSK